MTTAQAFNVIMESSLFRLDGQDIDLCDAIHDLCNAVNEEEETDWSLGESLECDLPSFFAGAYWALTEWHGGQNSPEYAAMCALGSIFNPGMTSGPEGDSEEVTYEQINEYFNSRNNPSAE